MDSFNKIQLSPITLSDEFCKEWNISTQDIFVHLTMNGELVNNGLYRKGGIGGDLTKKYFTLLKHTKVKYTAKEREKYGFKNKKGLRFNWCILDHQGNEKFIAELYDTPYIVDNSVIFVIGNKYYNIETGEYYCQSLSSMRSDDYIFLDNTQDSNPSKKGVMQINKHDGTWMLHTSC